MLLPATFSSGEQEHVTAFEQAICESAAGLGFVGALPMKRVAFFRRCVSKNALTAVQPSTAAQHLIAAC